MDRRVIVKWRWISILITLVLLLFFLIPAFYFDMKYQKIPNMLNLAGVLLGLLLHFLQSSWSGLIFSILGMIIGFFVLFLMYVFKAIGAGDVKLFAAIGSIAGAEFVLYSIMYSIIYAGVIGLVVIIWRKEWLQRLNRLLYDIYLFLLVKNNASLLFKKSNRHYQFPFMYAVFPAVITTAYFFL